MSTIWYEDVDNGLVNEILKCIKYIDRKTGLPVALPKDNIILTKPEDEYKDEVYPSVHITHLFESHDKNRYNPNQLIVGRNYEENVAQMKDSPVPFSLFYQLDFYSKFQTDINTMTSSWLKKHFRQFNLKVTDSDGDEVTINVMVNENMKSADYLEGYERIYRRIISYRIWVELDDEIIYNVPMVKDVSVITK